MRRIENLRRTLLKCLELHQKTFYGKMQKGIFNSNEIQTMIDEFYIEDPIDVFFAKAD